VSFEPLLPRARAWQARLPAVIARGWRRGTASRVTLEERECYRRWIAANGLAEAAGLGTTFVLGHAVVPTLARATGLAAILGSALAAVALGTLLEGVLIGFAQERVLRGRIAGLRLRAWPIATAVPARPRPGRSAWRPGRSWRSARLGPLAPCPSQAPLVQREEPERPREELP
jgi:hypothetical protein